MTSSARRTGHEALDILRRSPRRRKGFLTRVKLFDYGADPDQERLREDFMRSCQAIKAPIRQAGYAPKSFTYEVLCSVSRAGGVDLADPRRAFDRADAGTSNA